MIHRVALCLFTLQLLTAGLFAAPPPNVKVKFTAISWDQGIRELKVESDGKELEMFIPSFARSAVYEYEGPATMVLYTVEEQEDGQTIKTPAATATIPSDVTEVALLIHRQDGGYKVVVVDESKETFPEGMARFINITPYRVAVKGPSWMVELDPGQRRQMSADKKVFPVEVAMQRDGKWERVCNNIYVLEPHKRRTIFITNSDAEFLQEKTSSGFVKRNEITMFSITD